MSNYPLKKLVDKSGKQKLCYQKTFSMQILHSKKNPKGLQYALGEQTIKRANKMLLIAVTTMNKTEKNFFLKAQ